DTVGTYRCRKCDVSSISFMFMITGISCSYQITDLHVSNATIERHRQRKIHWLIVLWLKNRLHLCLIQYFYLY
ncbi:hypothetical protein BDA96_09G054200, partial [Sorghum bicolor]